MSTHWWSILNMLQSIVFSNHPVILALADANRRELILTHDEVARVKELIKILEFFQHVGLELGKENKVTITGIDYWFSYLKDTVLKINQTDSPMLKDMKKHMLEKLATRYSPEQSQYLRCIAYLDPLYKEKVNIDIEAFKTTVKNLYESTNIIAATPGQELQDIENPTFTTPTASSTTRSSHSQTLSTKDQMMMDLYSDDAIKEEIADLNHLEDRIANEVNLYRYITFTKKEKEETKILDWWKLHKTQFPCLFQAAKAVLQTPATSVPSERIFSEAGYIARARRSRIASNNLNRYLFIKRNMKYIPNFSKYFTQEMSDEAQSHQ